MSKPKITLIGLGETGRSIGLALLNDPGDFEVVGHDRSGDAETEAKRSGAVQRTEWNLHTAVEGAGLVIMAMPLHAVIDTFGHIPDDLAPDALVFVVNPLLRPVAEAAATLLPAHRRIVAGHPIRFSSSGASADSLQNVLFCIAAAAHAEAAAVELASDLVERVGANPHFVDAEEHDGIMAAVEQLPQVLGAALLSLNTRSGGWREARRLAGPRFGQAGTLLGEPKAAAAAFALNRDALLRRIDEAQRELAGWRVLIEAAPLPVTAADGKTTVSDSPLLDALQRVAEEQTLWRQAAASQKWETDSLTPAPSTSGILRQLFLGNIGRRRTPDDRSR